MSARHSKPATAAPRLRARTVLGGAAMTAVFLGGGAGVAMASESTPDPGQLGVDSIDLSKNADFQKIRGDVDDILGKVPFFESDPLGTHQKSGSGSDWHSNHGPNCGCHPHKSEDDKKKNDDQRHPCPPKSEHKKDESKPKTEDTSSESSSPKVQSIADTSDSQVESASTPASEDTQVESASTDETTPVGAADTGDGSSSPGFTPTFTPAASSSPLDNPFALGGGAAAAALLGAYGVSVARRRTGAHRG